PAHPWAPGPRTKCQVGSFLFSGPRRFTPAGPFPGKDGALVGRELPPDISLAAPFASTFPGATAKDIGMSIETPPALLSSLAPYLLIDIGTILLTIAIGRRIDRYRWRRVVRRGFALVHARHADLAASELMSR